ncbi:hypothetical protein [Streptomyces mirabilis]|uniref:hypothetical protein n=1 Tax=Streptomyces mirabilis TaxID=68239 RepID=UPI0038069488
MTGSRRAREARKKRASFAGQEPYSSNDELKSADMQPWKFTASDIPKIAAGALDAPAILKSINEALLPVVEEELERVAETLGALLEGNGAESDPAGVIRSELMRRVLPQIADSVRSGVIEGMRTRQVHLAQLAAIHRQTLESKSLRVVLARIDHELSRAGLEIVWKADDHSQFNVVEDPPGAMSRGPVVYEVAAPAYVDSESGKLVERGWLKALPKNPLPVPAAEKAKPGQKRRTTHTEAAKKQRKGLNGDPGDSPHEKKVHRGQAPGVQQEPGDSPTREILEEGSRGGARSTSGSPDVTTGGRVPKTTSYRQSLRAAASKQMNQRGTR